MGVANAGAGGQMSTAAAKQHSDETRAPRIEDLILQLSMARGVDEILDALRARAHSGRAAIETAERHLGTCTPFFEMTREIAHTHHEKWGRPRVFPRTEGQ